MALCVVVHVTCTVTVLVFNNGYQQTVIVVHEIQGPVHNNYCQITILLAHDLLSPSAYPMMTPFPPSRPDPIADDKPKITLIARQLPTSLILLHCMYGSYLHTHSYTYVHLLKPPVYSHSSPLKHHYSHFTIYTSLLTLHSPPCTHSLPLSLHRRPFLFPLPSLG